MYLKEKLRTMDEEKFSPAELAEYSAELARIASKLAQAEY